MIGLRCAAACVLALGAHGVAAGAEARELLRTNSEIAFSVEQMGVAIRGRFTRFDARITFDPAQPAAATAQISVDIASLSTGDAEVDDVALDMPWLNRAMFPRATFVSHAVRALGDARYAADGALTIRGRTRPLSFTFAVDAQPGAALLLSGAFQLRRTDFGIGGGEWNQDELIADEVPVTFRLWLAAPPPPSPPLPQPEHRG